MNDQEKRRANAQKLMKTGLSREQASIAVDLVALFGAKLLEMLGDFDARAPDADTKGAVNYLCAATSEQTFRMLRIEYEKLMTGFANKHEFKLEIIGEPEFDVNKHREEVALSLNIIAKNYADQPADQPIIASAPIFAKGDLSQLGRVVLS